MARDDTQTLGLIAAGAGLGLWWVLRRPSAHFSWDELTATSTGFENTPTLEDRIRLILLSRRLLEPMREVFGPLNINSAFRSAETNAAINGASQSHHLTGTAADLYSANGYTNEQMATWLYENTDLPVAEVVVYPDSPTSRIHVAVDVDGAPGERKFLSYDGSSYTTWTP